MGSCSLAISKKSNSIFNACNNLVRKRPNAKLHTNSIWTKTSSIIENTLNSCKNSLFGIFGTIGKLFEQKLDKIMRHYKANGVILCACTLPFIGIKQLEKAQEHALCANLAENSYADNPAYKIGEAKLNTNYTIKDEANGFYGCVYETDDKIYISYRGTNNSKDINDDISLFFYDIPTQYKPALELYERVATDPKNKDKEIVITGHSLGGSLAQLVAATKQQKGIKQPKAITFNAYGTKNIIKYSNSNKFTDSTNSINYSIKNDFIGYSREHTGQNFYLPPNLKNEMFSSHSIENFTTPDKLSYFLSAQNYIEQNNKEWLT